MTDDHEALSSISGLAKSLILLSRGTPSSRESGSSSILSLIMSLSDFAEHTAE